VMGSWTGCMCDSPNQYPEQKGLRNTRKIQDRFISLSEYSACSADGYQALGRGVVWFFGQTTQQTGENTAPHHDGPAHWGTNIFEEEKPPQYIFVLNGSVGFRSVATLKASIAILRPGTIIPWRQPCEMTAYEPIRAT